MVQEFSLANRATPPSIPLNQVPSSGRIVLELTVRSSREEKDTVTLSISLPTNVEFWYSGWETRLGFGIQQRAPYSRNSKGTMATSGTPTFHLTADAWSRAGPTAPYGYGRQTREGSCVQSIVSATVLAP